MIALRAAAVSAVILLAGASAPAHAASMKPDLNFTPCNGRTDFLRFWNISGAGPTCFANMGELGVDLKNVGCWSAGNNEGRFETTDGETDVFVPGSKDCFRGLGAEIVYLEIDN